MTVKQEHRNLFWTAIPGFVFSSQAKALQQTTPEVGHRSLLPRVARQNLDLTRVPRHIACPRATCGEARWANRFHQSPDTCKAVPADALRDTTS